MKNPNYIVVYSGINRDSSQCFMSTYLEAALADIQTNLDAGVVVAEQVTLLRVNRRLPLEFKQYCGTKVIAKEYI